MSSAKVVVILGDIAKAGVKFVLQDKQIDIETKFLGPMNLFGKMRVFLFLPHPNKRGGLKSVRGNLDSWELQTLKDWIL